MSDRRNPVSRRNTTDRRTCDRRIDGRIVLESEIRFMRAGQATGGVLHGDLLDVSSVGIRLVLDEPLQSGEKLLVEVRSEPHCFNMTAESVWIEPLDDGRYQVGCELCAELTDRQLALLNHLTVHATTA